LEGLASGPAIHSRWGASLSELASDDPANDIIAYYLAQLVIAQQALLSPQKIVLGGGVMATPGLLIRVQMYARILGSGYFDTTDYASLIALPCLDNAGLIGGLYLAQRAYATSS
jgi:fructokinase